MIEIMINGEVRRLDAPCKLSQLMAAEGMTDKGGVAVAINGKVVRKRDWDTVLVNEGHDLLIINAAYGG